MTKQENDVLEEIRKDIAAVDKKVTALHTTLLGQDGDKGMCGDLEKLQASHSTVKRMVYTLIGLLVGAGIISGSYFGLGL